MPQGYFCTDSSKDALPWLLCNALVGSDGTQLNPVAWGTDVISVNSDGTITSRPAGPNGPNENFDLVGEFMFPRTPVSSPKGARYGFRWIPLS